MNESWRIFIYPLGFLAPLLFGSRVITQWIYSEYQKESVVTRLFWHLSRRMFSFFKDQLCNIICGMIIHFIAHNPDSSFVKLMIPPL